MKNDDIRIGPRATIDVVFIWIVPPAPVTVMSTSHTVAPDESAIRAHVAVPVASADESCVIVDIVRVPAETEPHGSEQVSVPRSTCDVIASAGLAGIVPV